MQLIGLCGFANSGKSTAAEFLVREHGFTRLSFAQAVKDITAILFGWDRTRLEGNTPQDRAWREQPDSYWTPRMNRPWTPRYAMQFVGTDLCRQHVHSDIWAEQVLARIHHLGPTAKVVIDDVRFLNELYLLRRAGAQVAVIQRRQPDGTYFPSQEHAALWAHAPQSPRDVQTSLHQSEWNWLCVPDIKDLPVIQNEGSYDQFYAALQTWYTNTILLPSSFEVTTV